MLAELENTTKTILLANEEQNNKAALELYGKIYEIESLMNIETKKLQSKQDIELQRMQNDIKLALIKTGEFDIDEVEL